MISKKLTVQFHIFLKWNSCKWFVRASVYYTLWKVKDGDVIFARIISGVFVSLVLLNTSDEDLLVRSSYITGKPMNIWMFLQYILHTLQFTYTLHIFILELIYIGLDNLLGYNFSAEKRLFV